MVILPDEECKGITVIRPGMAKAVSGIHHQEYTINLHDIFSLIISQSSRDGKGGLSV
jgi:hypothetical protein